MKLPWLQADMEALGRSLDADRLGHAPLLQGPPGIGKSALAQWLVARILCQAAAAQRPCGVCRSCLLLQSGTHPDLFLGAVPEDKTQITVDVIRDLCSGLQLTPSIGRHRVGLIEPAERMNTNAANALLKTLEEPSPNSWLVLVTDRPDLLPATVRSRCQKLALRPPPRDEALRWLQEECVGGERAQLELALELSGGAPLKARDLIQGDELRVGLAVRSVLLDLAGGRPVSASVAEEWATRPEQSWNWVAHWIRQWLGGQMGLSPAAGEEHLAEPALGRARPGDLARAWQRALAGRTLADSAIRADLLFGKWLLEWQSIFADDR